VAKLLLLVCLEGFLQFVDASRVFLGDVGHFFWIGLQVVEFFVLNEFPWTFADGEAATVVVVDDAGSVGQGFLLSCDQWQDTGAVFGVACGYFGIEEVGHGRHEIVHTDEFITAAACGGFSGPADDEWDAVAAFVDLGFVSLKMVVQIDTVFFQLLEVGGVCGAVVGAENDERIFGGSRLFQSGHDVAYHGVGFDDEVGVVADAAFTAEFFAGRDGRVG